MKILFVCKHNRFRSRVAEAYFNKINKNKEIKAEGAGIFQGHYPLNEQQINLKKFDLNINGKPKTISTDLLRSSDLIVIVANDVPKSLFNYHPGSSYKFKVIRWRIPDEYNNNQKNTEKIIKSIMKRIDKLVKKLK